MFPIGFVLLITTLVVNFGQTHSLPQSGQDYVIKSYNSIPSEPEFINVNRKLIRDYRNDNGTSASNGTVLVIGSNSPGSGIYYQTSIYVPAYENYRAAAGVYLFTELIITRMEVHDNTGYGAHIISLYGQLNIESGQGVQCQSTLKGRPLNFTVRFYADFNINFTFGAVREDSVLLYQSRVNITAGNFTNLVNATVSYVGDGRHDVTRIEGFDQSTNLDGIYTNMTGTVGNFTTGQANLSSTMPGRGIHFLVNFYGHSMVNAHDFRFGNLLRDSVLLYRQRLTVSGNSTQLVKGQVEYQGNRHITMIQGLDQYSNSTGARLAGATGFLGDTTTRLTFESFNFGLGIDLIVEIYGN